MATFETLTSLTEKVTDGSITVSEIEHEVHGDVIEVRGTTAQGPIPPFLLDPAEAEQLRQMLGYVLGFMNVDLALRYADAMIVKAREGAIPEAVVDRLAEAAYDATREVQPDRDAIPYYRQTSEASRERSRVGVRAILKELGLL